MLFSCKGDFYHRIFEPLGIGYRHVRQLRGDEIVDSVVQLDIPIIDEYLNIEENNEDCELCPVCGTKKSLISSLSTSILFLTCILVRNISDMGDKPSVDYS